MRKGRSRGPEIKRSSWFGRQVASQKWRVKPGESLEFERRFNWHFLLATLAGRRNLYLSLSGQGCCTGSLSTSLDHILHQGAYASLSELSDGAAHDIAHTQGSSARRLIKNLLVAQSRSTTKLAIFFLDGPIALMIDMLPLSVHRTTAYPIPLER